MASATTDTGSNWVVNLAGAALVLALGYVVVKSVITFTNPESVWKQSTLASVSTQNSTSVGTQDYSFTTDPFNRKKTAIIEVASELGEDAPETTLNLTLTGRTAGPNGTAILRTPDNIEGNYRLGDEIVSGVTLQAVNKEFIVLDVDGQMQRLTFERGDDTGLTIKTAANEAAPLKMSVTSSVTSNSAQENIAALFQNISLRRVMKDGYLTGYSVKPNRPGLDLTPLGFSKGDVITAIGGTDITLGRPDFLALFEQAEKNGGIDVTVLRNGQIRTITLGSP